MPDPTKRRERVAIETLTPYPGNARQHDTDMLRASVQQHGVYRDIVVQASTMHVIAGNGTLEAARTNGHDEIDVTILDVDDDEARAINLIDNRANDQAAYDTAALLLLLEEHQAATGVLDGTGYDTAALDRLRGEYRAHQDRGSADPDALPEDVPAITEPGDVWTLGEHRLACGDARDFDTVDRLLDPFPVPTAMWTDPPYGVEYVGRTAEALPVHNDDAASLPDLLRDAFACADRALAPGAPIYVATPPGPPLKVFIDAFLDAGWLWRQQLAWVKQSMVLGHSDYHYKHESILYGFKPGDGRLGRGGERWYGGNDAVSVFEVDRPSRSEDHPTMKPVDLIRPMVANSTAPGDVVLDVFGGSGTTLIACEMDGRRAALVELSPRYCDVICRRFQQFAGMVPSRAGQPVSFIDQMS